MRLRPNAYLLSTGICQLDRKSPAMDIPTAIAMKTVSIAHASIAHFRSLFLLRSPASTTNEEEVGCIFPLISVSTGGATS